MMMMKMLMVMMMVLIYIANQSYLVAVGVGDVCFFLTMRCFNDAMFSNS